MKLLTMPQMTHRRRVEDSTSSSLAAGKLSLVVAAAGDQTRFTHQLLDIFVFDHASPRVRTVDLASFTFCIINVAASAICVELMKV